MKYAVLLAEKYSKLDYQDLGPGTVSKAKECILDCLSCIYAGLPFSSSRIVREYALEHYATGPCTIIGTQNKLVAPGACLANSTSGHGPELDDTSSEAVLHVGVIVIPVALALAEKLKLGGRDMLAAIAAGYDVHIKAGKAANPETHLAKGLHPTATCGMFAAAMTASKMMGLTVDQTANALGIVGSSVAGNLECYSDGSLTKRLQPGLASSSGVAAATLAAKGYTGPKGIFEGPRGFFRAYCDNPAPEELLKGEGFEIENISFKPHACCRFNQTPIDAALNICVKHDVHAEDIQSIEIDLSKTGYDIVGQPAEVKFNPQTVVDAQFSAPYSVAVACLERKAFLEEFSEAAIQRQDVRDLLEKTTIRHDPECDRFFPEAWPARVTITMADGQEFTSEIKYAKGDPKNRLSWEELLAKFNALVPDNVLSEEKKRQLMGALTGLEEIKDMNEFSKLLAR
ncbi:MAG: MmgE/PrpD family protein [Deltaproteobacteria bacterium]